MPASRSACRFDVWLRWMLYVFSLFGLVCQVRLRCHVELINIVPMNEYDQIY
jgi:hypothetical protein